jgi:hypothetical protein
MRLLYEISKRRLTLEILGLDNIAVKITLGFALFCFGYVGNIYGALVD